MSASNKHEAYRKRCENNPFNMVFIVKRSWCKARGVPFDLDAEYLKSIWTGVCPALGITLSLPLQKNAVGGRPNSANLDRLDPTKGYVKGNVSWISGRANRIKYDATVQELKLIAAWYEGATTIP